jgi:hypothetical protein
MTYGSPTVILTRGASEIAPATAEAFLEQDGSLLATSTMVRTSLAQEARDWLHSGPHPRPVSSSVQMIMPDRGRRDRRAGTRPGRRDPCSARCFSTATSMS